MCSERFRHVVALEHVPVSKLTVAHFVGEPDSKVLSFCDSSFVDRHAEATAPLARQVHLEK